MNGEAEHSAEGGEAPPASAVSLPIASDFGSFFQCTDRLAFAITTALALTVYGVTLAPEVTLQFSGEFSVSAMYPGQPFPPGYPLWTVYAWLFTCLLPWSNIAWRVAISSAVAGALTCGVVALMVSRGAASILEGVSGLKRLGPQREQALRVVCGCVAGLAFGLDSAFWSKTVVVDPWPLSMLLLATVLCLLMRWIYRPDRRGCLYAAAMVYGLTLTNSQALAVAAPGLIFVVLVGTPALGRDLFMAGTLLLGATLVAHGLGLLPDWVSAGTRYSGMWRVDLIAEIILLPLCLGLWLTTRGFFTEWKGVLISGALLALGLSLYLLLPWFSATNPPLNTGYARTLQGFTHTLNRGQFESVRPTDSFITYVAQLGMYVDAIFADFGMIYVVPVLVPFWFLRRMRGREQRWMLGLLAVCLCLSLLMVALLNPSPDQSSLPFVDRFFCASHLVLAVWAGYGLALLGTIMTRSSQPEDGGRGGLAETVSGLPLGEGERHGH